eukprot:31481-Pelagococcus_subviridis.AAC.6
MPRALQPRHLMHSAAASLLVRLHTPAFHSCSHSAHLQSALYEDNAITSDGSFSSSRYSRRSLCPRSPFSPHHLTSDPGRSSCGVIAARSVDARARVEE